MGQVAGGGSLNLIWFSRSFNSAIQSFFVVILPCIFEIVLVYYTATSLTVDCTFETEADPIMSDRSSESYLDAGEKVGGAASHLVKRFSTEIISLFITRAA